MLAASLWGCSSPNNSSGSSGSASGASSEQGSSDDATDSRATGGTTEEDATGGGTTEEDATGGGTTEEDATGGGTTDEGGTTAGGGASAVSKKAIYEHKLTEDVVYAQAVINSPANETLVDLKLDIYEPIGATGDKKPALMIIHGGGFVGGTKQQKQLMMFGEYFSKRGFVCFSVDYRVAKDAGLLPAEWPTNADAIQPGMSGQQLKALYTSARDVKAAVRWVRANAATWGVSPDHIAAMGGSAGAFLALMLGIVNEEDYRDEIDKKSDPTLLDTYLEQSSRVSAVIDLWGGTAHMAALEYLDGKSRYDESDAPVAIIHGTKDEAVPFTEAEEVKAAYDKSGVPYAFHPLDKGHGAWGAKIDGKNLATVSFEFIVEHMGLSTK
jgi:acetyl esterase/lipase